MAKVTLEHVEKVYQGGVKVVKDLNLEIEDGEMLVLVGPSGCGKSTTLRMVAGLEEISAGTIKIGTRVINDVHPKDRDIAMVFQDYALYPHMTVFENMSFGLRLRKIPKNEIERRVRETSRILGLDEYLARKPKALSGGQRQRVAMGRAIVREPAVFLFDEPLSNLDAKMRVEMRKEILRLHQRLKTTMIYVTHDQVEAMTLGDRICVMKDGIIQQVGAPAEVFDHPANRFVAGFIGTPAMNVLEGTLKRGTSGIFFDGGSLSAPLPESMTGRVKEYVDRKVCLGLRPRSFELPEHAPTGDRDTVFNVSVELDEMLGDDLLVHVRCGVHTFTVSVDPHKRRSVEGDFSICPIMTRAHIFDMETGQNLTRGLS